jgi:hypothetical protein
MAENVNLLMERVQSVVQDIQAPSESALGFTYTGSLFLYRSYLGKSPVLILYCTYIGVIFDVILATSERVLVSLHRLDAEGLISILKCLKAKSLSLPGRVLVELPRPSALRKRLVHFPFEIIIWDTKVF